MARKPLQSLTMTESDIKRQFTLQKMAEKWHLLKVGDKVDLGGNSPVIIKKKNKKSFVTTSGTVWTAEEVIGEAVRYL